MYYPSPNPEKPLFLKLLERFDRTPEAAAPNSSPTLVPETASPSSELTPVQSQQAQTKLAQLQTQLRVLSDAVTNLEIQLGIRRSSEPLEARIQAIASQLQRVQSLSSNVQSIKQSSANQFTTIADSLLPTDKLKVTLPSDILFEQSNSILRPEASLILDKVVTDLRNYPSSTIYIAAHTDTTLNAEDNRELSFRRANVVEQYLARTLGNQYRWLVIGYGDTRPLVANDTTSDQQRNRRVEIAVN
jgi:outer membrane protein OmpA-like peptidoglycan-associated protein